MAGDSAGPSSSTEAERSSRNTPPPPIADVPSFASAPAQGGLLAELARAVSAGHGERSSAFKLLDSSFDGLYWRLALIDSATESQLIDTFRVVYSTDAASPDRDSASSMTQGAEGDRPTAITRFVLCVLEVCR